MGFEAQVKEELVGFSEKPRRDFAWRCAVRALPFLGSNGSFDYWKKKERQEHLYSIFNLLDRVVKRKDSSSRAAAYVNPANAAANTVANTVANTAANAAVFAAASAAIFSASVFAPSEVASAASAVASIFSSKLKNIDIKAIILDDIERAKANKNPVLSTNNYGIVWANFQQALINEGCGYWAGLYKGVFENNFEMDRRELELRLNVPEEIKKQGAAAVGQYMEELLKGGAAPQ